MPRRTSRPAGGRRAAPRAAPSRAASTRTARGPAARPASPPAKANAQSKTPSQKSPAAQPPVPAPAPQPSPMGGFMANVASTGLGVMAGRAMDRAFFGGSGSSAEPVEEAPAGVSSSDDSISYSKDYTLDSDETALSVCAREALEFKKCMDQNSSNVGSCQWNLNLLAACQQREEEQRGFADAGRF